jgi:hypothetical protein
MDKHEFSIEMEKDVGQGANSTVTTGKLGSVEVVVKTFKDHVTLLAVRREVENMQKLSDSPNVVRLVGWCEEPACLVLQYYPLGSLRKVSAAEPYKNSASLCP